MATYIILANYTEQGIRNIKNSPERLAAAREMGKGMGGQIKEFYLTLGNYDFVAVAEAPDDAAAAKLLLALGAQGNVRTTTLRAFGENEYREITKSLP